MFRTVWSKTLRDYRVPALCWGLFLALYPYATYAAYGAGTKNEGQTFVELGRSFLFFADPVALNTPDGFTTWRGLSVLIPVLLSIWTLLAGSRLVRGEEERGSMDLLLATPLARTRLIVEKLIALLIVLLFIGVLIGLGALGGQNSAKVTVDAGRALLAGLNVSLIAFFYAAVALFLSQLFINRGTAAGITGAMIALSFLLDSSGRSIENADWLRHLSPLYYYNANKPLIASYPAHYGEALVLIGLTLVLLVSSVIMFVRRDIGGIAFPALQRGGSGKQARTVSSLLQRAYNDLSNRSVLLRAVRAQAPATFWWLFSIVVYTCWMTALTKSILEPLKKILGGNPALAQLFSGQDVATNAGFLSLIVFTLVAVLVVAFALTQALRWPSDLDAGRQELVLVTPLARGRILLERFAAVFVVALLAPLLIWVSVVLTANSTDLAVDVGRVAQASLGFLPMELVMIAFVYALASRVRSSLLTGITIFYLALAFVSEFLHSFLNIPEWTMRLSIFHNYGNPVKDGLDWTAFSVMLAIAVLLLIAGVLQFRRSDIERGG